MGSAKHIMAKTSFNPALPLAIVVLLAVIEVALIVTGFLSPVLSYSPGNLVFTFARFAIVVYAGVFSAKEGLKKSALNGSAIAFAASLAICIIAFFAGSYFGVPVLGLSVPNLPYKILMFAIIVVENTLLGAIVAVVAGWLSMRFGKGK